MNERYRILIPLDGSAGDDATLAALPPLLQAPSDVTLFHVVESPGKLQEVVARLEDHRRAVEALGARPKISLTAGKPAEEILRQTESGNFDIVALSTHGRSGLDRVKMGSVAEEVVRGTTIPALLCRPGMRTGDWKHIVVAMDGTTGSEEVLGDVVRLARSRGATVHLIQAVLGVLKGDSFHGVSTEFPIEPSWTWLESVAGRLALQGVSVVPERPVGFAAGEILALAHGVDAGLICMTTEGRPEELPSLDNSVAVKVIRRAPCPVFVRRRRFSG